MQLSALLFWGFKAKEEEWFFLSFQSICHDQFITPWLCIVRVFTSNCGAGYTAMLWKGGRLPLLGKYPHPFWWWGIWGELWSRCSSGEGVWIIRGHTVRGNIQGLEWKEPPEKGRPSGEDLRSLRGRCQRLSSVNSAISPPQIPLSSHKREIPLGAPLELTEEDALHNNEMDRLLFNLCKLTRM